MVFGYCLEPHRAVVNAPEIFQPVDVVADAKFTLQLVAVERVVEGDVLKSALVQHHVWLADLVERVANEFKRAVARYTAEQNHVRSEG